MAADPAIKLLPCPFCGGKAVAWRYPPTGEAVVSCEGDRHCCNVVVRIDGGDYEAAKAKAIAKWNTRPGDPRAPCGQDAEEEDKYRQYAKDHLATTELEFDDDAPVSIGDRGGWVLGWVLVDNSNIPGYDEEEEEDDEEIGA